MGGGGAETAPEGFPWPPEPYHGEVDVGGVELHVGHAVDGGLAVAVVVLADLGVHGGRTRRDAATGWMDGWTERRTDRRRGGSGPVPFKHC